MKPRKMSIEELNKKIEELEKLLGPLGFKCAHQLRFTHPDVPDTDFDFSVYDPTRVIYIAFQAGLKAGRIQKTKEFVELLKEAEEG